MNADLKNILEGIDSKISSLKEKGVTPKIIILGKIQYYKVIGEFQKTEDVPGIKPGFLFHNSSTVSANFTYKELPIFFDSTIDLPGQSSFIEVYGE